MQKTIIKIIKKAPLLCEIKFLTKRLIRPKFLYFLSNSTKPISPIYGMERGSPIDRFYIEKFLKSNERYIKGECLELLNNNYTLKYGKEKVSKSDIDEPPETIDPGLLFKLSTIEDNEEDEDDDEDIEDGSLNNDVIISPLALTASFSLISAILAWPYDPIS